MYNLLEKLGIPAWALYIIIACAIIVGTFIFACGYQHNKDVIVQDKAVNDQKIADSISCQTSKQTGVNIGNAFQGNLANRDNDYDKFLQINASCLNASDTGIGPNGSTVKQIILPVGTKLINITGYAKLLREAETQRSQVIGLQSCVKDPSGCKY